MIMPMFGLIMFAIGMVVSSETLIMGGLAMILIWALIEALF